MSDFDGDLTRKLFDKRENEEKRPSYESEMKFYHLISEGKMEELKQHRIGTPSSDDRIRGVLSENPLRNAVYHFIVQIAMITRCCIEAGLESDVAYEMSDLYINRADRAKTREEIREIQEEAICGFTRTMANLKRKQIYSKQVVLCIDYISENLHNNISVTELAEYVKLNETYLSKLFKREMGISITEYIREKKIDEAKGLLLYSDKSSIEIATDLGFSSHSYFISVFKKTTGMTPREYRHVKFRSTWEKDEKV